MSEINVEVLRRRSELLAQIRQFFMSHEYWEVETPLVSHDTCIDRWLDPFELNIQGERCFLQTSPEFAMKRLLCKGADSIFQICKAFRKGELGANHNPEFTMLEWYSTRKTLPDQITFVESIISEMLSFTISKGWLPAGTEFKFQQMTYESAFQRYTGLSAMSSELSELESVAARFGWQTNSSVRNDRDDILNFILANAIEPELAKLQAVSITDYPATQSALATIKEGEHPVADRFEMYLNGIEICNGYQELTDPHELRERMQTESRKRRKNGISEYPVESYLLQTMEAYRLPECSGVALGIDRLVMILLGQETLQDVIAFPFPNA